MTRDFKIGLIAGAGLAFIALIWVAMRPSLSPQARMTSTPSTTPNPALETTTPKPKTQEPESTPAEPQFTYSPPPEPIPRPAEPEQGIFQPETAEPIQEAQTEQDDPNAPAPRYHIVRKDETLSFISQLYYDTPNQWRKIVEANPETIKDANKISLGMKLLIPE